MSSVPSRVVELIETFDRDVEAYHSQQYNETQLRREFIDPFFEELGWDVTNKAGYAQAYKDVIHEDAIKVGGATKAPDYCFRIGGVRKFFLEAKKPSVNIKGDPHPAYQLRRYAWSAKLPLSILTDFEEFAVYDCQTRPKQTDKADTARIMYFTYKDYPDKWAKIADVFSRDAILKGSFDKFAVATKGKRGTTTVDVAFLAEIEKWRDMLARIIALRNRALSVHEINFAVQRTIDRTLFLRMCEDRGIEDYGQLLKISTGDRTYPRLCEIFEKADQKYNSGLFHFHDEPGRPEAPDELTPNLIIDDGKLKWILHSLYYPQCPYVFYVLPAEILGNVYEQFLGSVIQVSPGRQVKIVPKPEVKKAGGVYYTPSYIVDYIVKNTVGKLLGDPSCHCEEDTNGGRQSLAPTPAVGVPEHPKRKPLTPRQVANLRILDPACGSGSFLLGAYTCLLNYLRDWYVDNDPQKHTKKIYQGKGGQWHLTNAEKKRILLNNIFGVDIDSQAVEVTKLSLLLKVLEGEDAQTLENQYRLFHERALPDLANNIKCGNSLIGPDFFETVVIPSAREESIKIIAAKRPQKRLAPAPVAGDSHETTIPNDLYQKINPFDWHTEFPQIFSRKNPGFDAVIGNPPYVRIQTMKDTQPQAIPYFSHKYQSASKGNYDIYIVFAEKGLGLLNQNGGLGFILPHKFFQAKFGQPIRKLISDKKAIAEIVHFGAEQVFANATTYTCLLFLSAKPKKQFRFVSVKKLENPDQLLPIIKNSQPSINYKEKFLLQPTPDSEWHFFAGDTATILNKLKLQPLTLADITRKIFVGLQTSADQAYVLNVIKWRKRTVICYSKSLEQQVEIEQGLIKPFLMGKDVHRYEPPKAQNVVIFPYVVENGKAILMTQEYIRGKFPTGWKYLLANKEKLAQREKGKMIGDRFYAYIYPKNLAEFETTKVMTPEIAFGCQLTFDSEGVLYHTTKVYSFVFKDAQKESPLFFLGILNSKLLWLFLKATGYTLRGGYFTFKTEYLKPFPIRIIDFDSPDDKAVHDKMVKLVERILDLHKKLAAAKIPTDKTHIQRQIDNTDKQIDNLVYQLYGLTQEEIKIVENSSK